MNRQFLSRASRIGTVGAVAAILAVGLGACSTDADVESSDESATKGAVAMSFAGADVTIWNDQLKIMRPIIEAAGYEFLTDDPQWDAQKQVADWQAWIQRGDVKAIMGFPVQADAIVPVTAEATAAGISVIGYAAEWEGTVAALTTDAYADGYMLGSAAAEWINTNDRDAAEVPVAILEDQTSELGKARTEGILDGVRENAENAVVFELPGVSREDGNASAKSQLIAQPDTKVWLGTSNDNAMGAYQAVIDSGVAPDDPTFAFGALDATNETLDIIKLEGIWRFGYTVTAKQLAEINAQLLIDAAEGRTLESVALELSIVTPENADEFYID